MKFKCIKVETKRDFYLFINGEIRKSIKYKFLKFECKHISEFVKILCIFVIGLTR